MAGSASSQERPIRISGHEFADYLVASRFLLEHVTETNHLSRAFVPEVYGELIIEEGSKKQKLRLTSGQSIGLVDRYMSDENENGVVVSGNLGKSIALTAHVEPWGSDLINRGATSVHISQDTPPFYTVNVLDKHDITDPIDLAGRLNRAEMKSVEFIEAILRSEVIEPIARGYWS